MSCRSDLREQALASPDPDIRALADLKGKLPNTAGAHRRSRAAALAYVDGDLNVGVSVSHHTSKYDVPIRYLARSRRVEAEAPTIDAAPDPLRRPRRDPARRLLQPCPGSAAAIAKYHHDEIEDDGAIGSSFFSKGGEVRGRTGPDASAAAGAGPAASSISTATRASAARRNSCPTAASKQAGLFTLQTLRQRAGPVRRRRARRVQPARRADARCAAGDARTAIAATSPTVSGSLGGNYEFAPGWRAGLSLSHSERAPAIDELFANGPHGGSQSFEVGDPDLDQGSEQLGRAQPAPHDRAGARPGQPLLQPLLQLHFPGADRRNPRTICRSSNIARARPNYYGFELQGDAKLGKALGIDWGGELSGRRGPRDDQGFRPGAADPAAAGARRADRRARPGRRPARGRARLRPRPHRADRDRHARLHAGQCLARLAPVRGQPGADAVARRATICSTSTPGAAPASSRIMPRSPAATSG